MTAVEMRIIPIHDCGQEQLAARQPHKLEVRGSSPRPANADCGGGSMDGHTAVRPVLVYGESARSNPVVQLGSRYSSPARRCNLCIYHRRNEQGGSPHGSSTGGKRRRSIPEAAVNITATQAPPAGDGGAGPAGLENRNETQRWGSRRGCGRGGVGGGWRVDRACSVQAHATIAAAIRPVAAAPERGTGTRPAAGPERLREPGQGDHHRARGDDRGGAAGSVCMCGMGRVTTDRDGSLSPDLTGWPRAGRYSWRTRSMVLAGSIPALRNIDGSTAASNCRSPYPGRSGASPGGGLVVGRRRATYSMYPAARLVAVPGELRYCGCWRGDGPV